MAASSSSKANRWGLTIQTMQSPPRSNTNSDWLWTSLLAARTLTAAAESFPYLKGVFGIIVILLETIETVKKNREDLKELCRNVMEIVTIVREQISLHGDTAAVKFKGLCGDLEECLHGVLSAVKELERKPSGLLGRFKEIIRGNKTADEIAGYGRKIRELRSNFVLTATMDTNFQVHKVLTVISPVDPVPPIKQRVTNCPLPSRIFHGRQNILDGMHDYFLHPTGQQHIFLLHGLGGAGKSQIGLKFVQTFGVHLSDIFLIDASTTETIETSLRSVATKKNSGSTSQDALRRLSNDPKQWLLFFDNADDPKINLNQYFPKCDHGNILITSRNPGLCVYAGSHSLVSDLDETEAVVLLLKSAAQEISPKNKQISAEIVKALWYFPLAIIQAGAFIAKSGALGNYLELYTRNWERLLSERPAQSHDEYAWTVYTTWQMSFDKLSPAAVRLFQLCSLLHHQGISEEIFRNASSYKPTPGRPKEEELKTSFNFLSQFVGPAGDWESLHFLDATNDLRAYSLIELNLETNLFSIHPLVHSWTKSTLSATAADQYCMGAILGMCIATMKPAEREAAALWLVPHIESLLQGRLDVAPDFNIEYGAIYSHSGRPRKAEQLEIVALEKQTSILGEDHPDTLKSIRQLAKTYHQLGQFEKAQALEIVVLEKQKTILGQDDPEILLTMGLLSVTYIELGQYEEAEKLEVILLEKRCNTLGPDHPQTLITMGNLGWVRHSLGNLKEAEDIQVAVLERQKHILGAEHVDTLWTMGNLGSTYRGLGQLERAEQLELFVCEKQTKILGQDHPYTLWTMGNLALTYKEQGHLRKAEEIQVSVLDKKRRTLGDKHPETVRAMEELELTGTRLAEFTRIYGP